MNHFISLFLLSAIKYQFYLWKCRRQTSLWCHVLNFSLPKLLNLFFNAINIFSSGSEKNIQQCTSKTKNACIFSLEREFEGLTWWARNPNLFTLPLTKTLTHHMTKHTWNVSWVNLGWLIICGIRWRSELHLIFLEYFKEDNTPYTSRANLTATKDIPNIHDSDSLEERLQ